jgi:hypothetical protein
MPVANKGFALLWQSKAGRRALCHVEMFGKVAVKYFITISTLLLHHLAVTLTGYENHLQINNLGDAIGQRRPQ